jgi:hypothetical protein
MNFKKPLILLEYSLKGVDYMKLNNLGFDFSNLSTCTVKRKNGLLAMVMFILTGSFLPTPLIFIILYLNGKSIEINGEMVNYGDPSYNDFYLYFVGGFLLLSLFFLILGIYGATRKPKDYIIMDLDKTDFEKIYYIFNWRRKEEIYLNKNIVIIYNYKLDTIAKFEDHNSIKEYFDKYIFWYDFSSIDNAKIRQTKKSIIVKIKKPSKRSFTGSIMKRFVFSNQINVVPERIVEYIGYASAGSVNYQSRNVYLFEDQNRAQQLRIHPEIKKALQGLV